MSQEVKGVVLKTPDGRFVRMYRAQDTSRLGHKVYKDYVQTTPDIGCATVFNQTNRDHIKLQSVAVAQHPDAAWLNVTVTRTITIVP